MCQSLSHVQLCDPRDRSPPGSSVPGILQARTLEWAAMPFFLWTISLKKYLFIFIYFLFLLFLVLRAGPLGRPRGMGWGERLEGGLGWGAHVNPWLIHVNVWQKPLQYCKVIRLQLIKINENKCNYNLKNVYILKIIPKGQQSSLTPSLSP